MVRDRSTEQARQGRTGKGVRYVLGVSLLLAVIAMAVLLGIVT